MTHWTTKKLKECITAKMDLFGLTFNIVGTLLTAFAIGEIPCRGSTTCGGVVYKFAYVVHPLLFKTGLIVIILGFVLQLSNLLIMKRVINK